VAPVDRAWLGLRRFCAHRSTQSTCARHRRTASA